MLSRFDPSTLDPALYRYDAEKADRCVRFIHKYLVHYEAQHAGKPFALMPWQQDVIRQLYGVYRVDTGLRRYRYLYCEGPKSLGKSPLLAGMALYHLLVEAEASPFVVSCASTFNQARIIFDAGKAYIRQNDTLMAHALLHQYEILAPERSAKWSVMSGVAKGKSGFRPSLILIDELHEFESKDAELFEFLEGNLIKRHNSLMLIATNAGFDLNGICGQWHKRAMNLIQGLTDETNVLPVVFNAPDDDDIGNPETWMRANPSIGTTISLNDYAAEYAKVKANPSKEIFFRRLFLGQWVKSAKTWLTASDIAKCIVDQLPDTSGMACYLGLDVGPVDDITALIKLYVDEENDQIYVDVQQWLPREAADFYQDSHAIPYYRWAEQGFITLLPGRTVDTGVKKQIAQRILEFRDATPGLVQMCYDKYKADEIIFDLEQAGVICEPISSSFSGIGPATKQLERRIIDHTIHWVRNDCLLWQLSNAQVEADKSGNIRPIRFGARGTKYIGADALKIDSVMAMAYAFSRGYLQSMRKEDDQQKIEDWSGEIPVI